MPKRFFERFNRLDDLIARKATGTPKELADKLEISESTLYEYLIVMKDLGAPIRYDKLRSTYYYEVNGKFQIKFLEDNL